jgi:hypothetical protein
MAHTIFSRYSFFVLAALVALILLAPLPNRHPAAAGNAKTSSKNALPPQASVPAPGPEKGGLASLYPGDEGIERDPRVLFVDDFETGTVDAIGARWGNISKSQNIRLSDDIHADSPGNKSVHISNNGHLYTHTNGVDTMYARFYVKFHPKTGYVHHFVHLVADRVPTPPRTNTLAQRRCRRDPARRRQVLNGHRAYRAMGKVPAPRCMELLHLLARDED